MKVTSYKPKAKGCRISLTNQTAGSAKEKLDSAPTVKNVDETASQSLFKALNALLIDAGYSGVVVFVRNTSCN